MKKKSLLTLLACLPLTLLSQDVKLINSVEQSWSGGIAGRHGENYSFVIEFSHFKKEPLPDSIWIQGKTIPIIITDSLYGQNVNAKRTRGKNTVQFYINAGVSYDDYADRFSAPGDKKKEEYFHPPIDYKGVALLSYKYKGKEKYFVINKIMERRQPINYP